jgi:hypothetical protein
MTQFQIIALSLLAVIGFVQFILPNLKLPQLPASTEKTAKPDALKYIAQVIAIRDSSTDPKVVEACKALLQTLI